VLAKRERVIVLQPWDKGLMATTLRYPYEIRDPKEYFDALQYLSRWAKNDCFALQKTPSIFAGL